MFTLNNFYKSKQWEKLLQVIKAERLNDDGFIYCEHCGEPIYKAYDCIGHHITELTEDNVNDYDISLNPENIMLVHHKCHNEIHKRFGFEGMKQVYIVYGAPCSGKYDYVKSIASSSDLVVDIDSIHEMISINRRYTNTVAHKSIVFEVRDKLLEVVKYRSGKWSNAYVIGGYPLRMDRERLEQRLNASSIFVEATKEECLSNARERFNDTETLNKFNGYIEEWFERYQE